MDLIICLVMMLSVRYIPYFRYVDSVEKIRLGSFNCVFGRGVVNTQRNHSNLSTASDSSYTIFLIWLEIVVLIAQREMVVICRAISWKCYEK